LSFQKINNRYIILFVLLFTYTFAGWAPQISGTNTSLNDVYFPNDTLTGYICGDSGIILKTTNSGNDWVRQNTPVTTQLNAIYFIGDTGWSVGSDLTALSTTNGGSAWSGTSTPGGLTLHDVYFSNNGFGIIIGERGFCMITWDGGMTWEIIMMPIDITLRSAFFINNILGWIVGDLEIIQKTVNAGLNWILQHSGTFTLRGVYFTNEHEGYAIGDAGKMLQTTDGGSDWEDISMPISYNLYGIDFEDNETGYICGDSGFVYKLYSRYTIIDSSIDLYSINFPAPMVGWTVGSKGSIYKTSDGMAVTEQLNKRDFRSISFSPNPFTDYFTVKTPTQIKTTLKIYDKAGNLVFEEKMTNGRCRLNSRFLSKGIYFIKVNGMITKVIKI
jgi:photosystem II stability/assembly factor-like uncharacterized protein